MFLTIIMCFSTYIAPLSHYGNFALQKIHYKLKKQRNHKGEETNPEVLSDHARMFIYISINFFHLTDGSDGENHFTEAGAVAKELQSDLGVRQLTKSFQNAARLSDAGLGVLVAKVLVTHQAAQSCLP